jgi:DNA mismatch repair protein MutL
MEIVHGVMDETNGAKAKIDERIALSMAKQVAIVAGQLLSQEEMTTLVDELFRTSMPSIAPDGSTIVYIMPDKDIERNFLR